MMDDLAAALDTIDGLRTYPYWVKRIMPPAAVVSWPEPLTYDMTMRRGGDRATLPVRVVVGNVDARSSRDTLARYVDGAGPQSVKQAVEGYAATAYGEASVRSASFEVVTIAGVDYLAAEFEVDVTGRGT